MLNYVNVIYQRYVSARDRKGFNFRLRNAIRVNVVKVAAITSLIRRGAKNGVVDNF